MRSFKIILGIVLFVALVFGVTWVSINFEQVKNSLSGTQIYTKADVDAAYENGYEDALLYSSEHELLLAQYRNDLTDAQHELALSVAQKNTLLDTVANLENAILSINEGHSIEKVALENLVESLQEQVQSLTLIISDLEQELALKIAYYEDLLTQLDFSQRVIITFKIDETIVDMKSVEVGSKITTPLIQVPIEEHRQFLGWSVDRNLVDVSFLNFSEDTVLMAVYRDNPTATFLVSTFPSEGVLKTEVVIFGGSPTPPSNTLILPRYGTSFLGWVDSTDDYYWDLNLNEYLPKIINFSTYSIYENTTFRPYYEWSNENEFSFIGTPVGHPDHLIKYSSWKGSKPDYINTYTFNFTPGKIVGVGLGFKANLWPYSASDFPLSTWSDYSYFTTINLKPNSNPNEHYTDSINVTLGSFNFTVNFTMTYNYSTGSATIEARVPSSDLIGFGTWNQFAVQLEEVRVGYV